MYNHGDNNNDRDVEQDTVYLNRNGKMKKNKNIETAKRGFIAAEEYLQIKKICGSGKFAFDFVSKRYNYKRRVLYYWIKLVQKRRACSIEAKGNLVQKKQVCSTEAKRKLVQKP